MKAFIVASLLLAAVGAILLENPAEQFQAFKLKHSKKYQNQAEEATRFIIFQSRLQAIEEHNAQYEQGFVTYKKGINKFTDWTDEERQSLSMTPGGPVSKNTIYSPVGASIPDSVDLRTEGLVTEVKDQAASPCYFGVVGAVEGLYARLNKTLVALSEQQIADCVVNTNCAAVEAYEYIETYGLEPADEYSSKDGTCNFDETKVVTKIKDYVSIEQDEEILAEAVYLHGPIASAIDATYLVEYASGIFTSNQCSTTTLNLRVLIVGYGSENGTDFWIIKNSWGSAWGEAGYFRIGRGSNECGIALDDSYPVES